MAVEIPRLQRFDTQAPESAGRLRTEAPNLLGATASLREGFQAGLSDVSEALDARQKEIRKQQLAAKDLKALEYSTRYEQKLKTGLDSLKQMKGDTTQAYKAFDESMVKAESELYDEVTDPETQQLLREKVIRANGRITDTRSTQYTQQYFSWQKEVADSSVKLRQDNAAKDAQFLDVKNPLSFAKVQKHLDEIEATRVAIAQQNGYNIPVKVDENGVKTIDYSQAPMIESQIKADIGDALIPTVKSLNAAGKVKEAKQLIDSKMIKRWLNAKDLATLTAENDEANVKNLALEQLAAQPEWTIDQINGLKGVGEDVKLKMREINHTNSLHREREQKKKADDTYLKMINEIEATSKTANPYVSPQDFKDRSPLYKNNRDLLSASQRKALDNYFDQNRSTDYDTMADIYEMFRNNELDKLTGAQVMEMRSKLSTRDEARFQAMYQAQTRPTSEAAKNVLTKTAIDRVNRSFERLTYTDGSPIFKRKNNGKFSKSDNELLDEVTKRAEDYVKGNPKWTQEGEDAVIAETLQDIQARKQKERDESLGQQIRGFFRGFMGPAQPSTPANPFKGGAAPVPANPVATAQPAPQAAAQPGTTTTANEMSKWTPTDWVRDYQSRHSGKMPPNNQMGAVLKRWKEQRMSGEIK